MDQNSKRKVAGRLAMAPLALAIAMGCGNSDTTPYSTSKPAVPITVGGPIPATTSLDCPKGTTLTYENFGEAFIADYCSSCHSAAVKNTARQGAPESTTFTNVRDVQFKRAGIISRLAGGPKAMPPKRTLPASDLASANEWLKCGAPTADDRGHLP